MAGTQYLDTCDEAVAGVEDGATILAGGFGGAGMPFGLIDALIRQGAANPTVVANNAGNAEVRLAALLQAGRVDTILCSFPRQVDSWVFDRLYRQDKVSLEVVPREISRSGYAPPVPASGPSSAPGRGHAASRG